MELSVHVVEAAILRAAFIILGFMWGVIIVPEPGEQGMVQTHRLGPHGAILRSWHMGRDVDGLCYHLHG